MKAPGRTPLVPLRNLLDRDDVEVWAKLEMMNPGGSSKARSAYRMVRDAFIRGELEPGSTVIESTSGNLGIGLALACRAHDLQLVCVVDSRTDVSKVRKMEELGATVRIVTEPDPTTGDLLTARLALVKRLVADTPGSWNPDQYANPSNPAAHSETMAEIDEALDGDLDWLFVATSTTGTLRGCCDYLVAAKRQTGVVAVDAVGSVLFGGRRAPRRFPGMGAGVVTPLSRGAWFDRLIRVNDRDSAIGCRQLLTREGIFAGASSGGLVKALESLAPFLEPGSRCALILPDGGEGYRDTAYDDAWVERELDITPAKMRHLAGALPRLRPA